FNQTVPLTADDLAVWRHKPGPYYYWEVDFLGKDIPETARLCSRFCADFEPGHKSGGNHFNNLSATMIVHAAGRFEILLQGTMNVGGNASIRTVTADRWVSRNTSRGGFMGDTPRPIKVVAGQQVFFTLVMSVSPSRG